MLKHGPNKGRKVVNDLQATAERRTARTRFDDAGSWQSRRDRDGEPDLARGRRLTLGGIGGAVRVEGGVRLRHPNRMGGGELAWAITRPVKRLAREGPQTDC